MFCLVSEWVFPPQAHSKALDALRQEFEAEAVEMEAKSVKRIKDLQNQLDLKRKTELIAQEEKKNNFLSTIIANHEKTFDEMKKYYTDITATNLKLITELKVMCIAKNTGLLGIWEAAWSKALHAQTLFSCSFPSSTFLFLLLFFLLFYNINRGMFHAVLYVCVWQTQEMI